MGELVLQLRPLLVEAIKIILAFIGIRISQFIKSKTTELERKEMLNIIQASVQFVEQVSGKNINSHHKYELALRESQRALDNAGIHVSEEELRMWIESFVHGLNEGADMNGKN